jgi:cystathionine gamma-synthase/methionine-gamma-lyase
MKPATIAVHAGQPHERGAPREAGFAPTTMPVHAASAFVHERASDLHAVFARDEGYSYSRHANPTVASFERAVAALEHRTEPASAVAFGSGMAALHAAIVASLRAAGARDGVRGRVLAARDLYGATIELLRRYLSASVDVAWVDTSDLGAVEAALSANVPTVLLAEVVSNPLLRVADVAALAKLARAAGAKTVIDATFVTPLLSRPLELGADVSVHSATKYLGGHGDATGGVASMRAADAVLVRELRHALRYVGGVLAPAEAYSLARGLRTLCVRLPRQVASAAELASRLASHPRVARVHYPKLDPHTAAARTLDGGAGAMVSFEVDGASTADVEAFFDRLRVIVPATTLGDVASLVLHPASTSHRSLSPAERAERGIGEGLVRLSVGIEDEDDLWHDLTSALG